jgi:hypothetical protein
MTSGVRWFLWFDGLWGGFLLSLVHVVLYTGLNY